MVQKARNPYPWTGKLRKVESCEVVTDLHGDYRLVCCSGVPLTPCLDSSYTAICEGPPSNHILSIKSPAIEPVVDDGPEELKPPSWLKRSWTATLGT
jgi:hypothetical protein